MPGGIDHLVPVAHDLDKLADFYRDLGFTVGARNRHAWGTLNHIVQFDGCFIELLTTEPGFERPADDQAVTQFAGPLANYLAAREGLAMCVLESTDAATDQAYFEGQGIAGRETFYFERKGKRPDGSPVDVAFSLAFARQPGQREGGFFVCQQHVPEAFWNPAFQSHPNGVRTIAGATFVSADPGATRDFFQKYTGKTATGGYDGGYRIATDRGWIDILDGAAAEARYGPAALPNPLPDKGFIAMHFAGAEPREMGRTLTTKGIPHTDDAAGVVIAARDAHGITLVFEPPS